MSRRKTRSSLAVLTVLGMLVALMPLVAAPVAAADDHLQLTEIVVTPTAGEFIEIHNPTGTAIDLTDYYLTDATFAGGGAYYYNIVTGADYGGGGFADFHARFPSGASIGAGEYQTIALDGSSNFNATYGALPTYELYEDGATADSVPDMLEAVTGSINGQGGLTNGGEFVVLRPKPSTRPESRPTVLMRTRRPPAIRTTRPLSPRTSSLPAAIRMGSHGSVSTLLKEPKRALAETDRCL